MANTVADELRRFQRILTQNLHEAQQQTTEAQADEWRTQIVVDDAVASREYLHSIRTRTTLAAAGRQISEAYSDVIQAAVMEHGRRAGARMPPVDAILEWMPYRGMEPNRSHAFAIAVNIGRYGLPARHIAQNAFRRSIPRALGDVNLAVAKSVHEFNSTRL